MRETRAVCGCRNTTATAPRAEQVRVPTENAVPIGPSAAEAAAWCWLGTCLVPYGGLAQGGLKAGETVLVSGATGNFGRAAVAVALAMGGGLCHRDRPEPAGPADPGGAVRIAGALRRAERDRGRRPCRHVARSAGTDRSSPRHPAAHGEQRTGTRGHHDRQALRPCRSDGRDQHDGGALQLRYN